MEKVTYFWLIKLSNGYNLLEKRDCIATEVPDLSRQPGVKNFWTFLQELRLDYHDAILELAQVLKIPVEQMREFGQAAEGGRGFITGDACINIREYCRVRLPPATIKFLASQQGDAGQKNKYDAS